MDLAGKRILVIGGAGFIGSHVVDQLLKTDVREVVVYDNFFRGSLDNLKDAARANVLAMQSGANGVCYNVGRRAGTAVNRCSRFPRTDVGA